MGLGYSYSLNVLGSENVTRLLRRDSVWVYGQPNGLEPVGCRKREQQGTAAGRVPVSPVALLNFVSDVAGIAKRHGRTDS